MTGAAQDKTGAEVVSLRRERIRRRIRRRLQEQREERAHEKNAPAAKARAEARSRRLTEIAEIVIEEVMGQSPNAHSDEGAATDH